MDTKLSELPSKFLGEELIEIPPQQRVYRVGDLINYVAEQAIKQAREDQKVMFRIPEVQIERPFRDPQDRINAMLDFEGMRGWSYIDSASPIHGFVNNARLIYCNVKNGVIVWKFAFQTRQAAISFDETFDPDQTATTE